MVYEGEMVDPPLCESGDSRIVTGRTPKKEKWQMWSLRWSEKPEERDRNPSSPHMVSVAQLGERMVVNHKVVGSKPTIHTKIGGLAETV